MQRTSHATVQRWTPPADSKAPLLAGGKPGAGSLIAAHPSTRRLVAGAVFFGHDHPDLLRAALLAFLPPRLFPVLLDRRRLSATPRIQLVRQLRPRRRPVVGLRTLALAAHLDPRRLVPRTTVDDVLLIFCPPGPEPRTKRSTTSPARTPAARKRAVRCGSRSGKSSAMGGNFAPRETTPAPASQTPRKTYARASARFHSI